ncbi:MAG TPA: NAD(P)/FAD-dependent oxidoreductase [Bacteroidaceae bacterium]|nr:NAD(P)/FAD-dependent oxidoreductase [Bacteroidaceae bacterium]
MNYDIIIIGGGLGGLTSGAKLAKEGKRILLLEQHDRPGGCATTFKRKHFTMEVGLHEMDGLHPRDMKTKIFRDLGIFEKVHFAEVPEFYRFINQRQDIVIPHNPDDAQKILEDCFPHEKDGIKEYFNHVLNARKIVSESVGKPDRSIGEFLDQIITNEDLKLVLLGNLGYFHDDPYSISWLYYLSAQGSYYSGGAKFVKGGSQMLSNALSEVIEEFEGTVKLNSLVTSIEFDGMKATGVTYKNLDEDNQLTHSVSGNIIIVNAAVPNLANELLPSRYSKNLREQIKRNKIGASLLTVYYGFNKPLCDLGNKYYSTCIYDPSVRSQADILTNNHSDFSVRSFILVDYSQIDSRLAPPGNGVGAVCCLDYASDWEGLNREMYRKKKADVAEIFTERCEKIISGFREALDHVEVGTSLTVKRYTLNPDGAVYGFAQNPGKSTDYLSALPDNIYLASAWGKFGGGFSGSIYSGYMTALDILRKQ